MQDLKRLNAVSHRVCKKIELRFHCGGVAKMFLVPGQALPRIILIGALDLFP